MLDAQLCPVERFSIINSILRQEFFSQFIKGHLIKLNPRRHPMGNVTFLPFQYLLGNHFLVCLRALPDFVRAQVPTNDRVSRVCMAVNVIDSVLLIIHGARLVQTSLVRYDFIRDIVHNNWSIKISQFRVGAISTVYKRFPFFGIQHISIFARFP